MRIRVASLACLLLAGLCSVPTLAATAAKPGGAVTAGGKAGAATTHSPAANPAAKSSQPVRNAPGRGQFLADTVVLCRVGPRVTTVADYVRLYFASYIEDRPDADSAGRVTFLDNIVAKEVLGQLALQINQPLRFEDRTVMREFEQRALSNALYRTAVIESLQVSEDEIEKEYESFQFELRLRHITFADEATASRVRLDLLRGRTSWQQAYDRYSLSKGKDKGPDGELGWTVRGGQPLQTARKIFGLNPGGISEPIDDAGVWNVVQVVERRPGHPPALGAVHEYLRAQLADEKSTARSRAVRDLVRKQIGMVYDTLQIAWAASHFTPVQSMSRDENGVANINFDVALPDFSPADTSRVLARYQGGVMTLGNFFHQYTDIQPLLRMSVNTPELMRDQIDGFAFEPFMAEVARQRGLDRDSTVMAQIAGKREEILVEHLYSDSVLSRVSIDPRARRKYYQDHLSAFVTYSQVRFAAMWADSKEAADKLAARLKGGEKAEDILRADSLLGIDRGSIQTRAENDHGTYQKLLFEGLRPGQITIEGPDRVGHYSVIQELQFIPGHQLSYEESAAMIDETMQNTEAERLLKALVARHRRRWPIYERRDLVMQVKLVDPTL